MIGRGLLSNVLYICLFLIKDAIKKPRKDKHDYPSIPPIDDIPEPKISEVNTEYATPDPPVIQHTKEDTPQLQEEEVIPKIIVIKDLIAKQKVCLTLYGPTVGKQALRTDRCFYFLETTMGLILEPAILKLCLFRGKLFGAILEGFFSVSYLPFMFLFIFKFMINTIYLLV